MCRLSLKALISALAPAAALAIGAFAAPALAASDNCPSVQQLPTKLQSAVVFYDYSGVLNSSTGDITFTYEFQGADPANVYDPVANTGIPGLITYCVYPQGGNLPNTIFANFDGSAGPLAAVGANTDAFKGKIAAKGSFSFTRADGDPSNIPFDGNIYTMGTATWNGTCVTDPISLVTVCTNKSTETQTVLLHINDPVECSALYGAGATTCWVFPTQLENHPPPPQCNGDVACKSAVIDEATGDFDANGFPIVPMFTLLHIHYSYVIVNQAAYGVTMTFNVPTAKTQDINAGGGKDYFGCEQIPDSSGMPGGFVTVNNYESTGLQLKFFPSNGNNCAQSRFQLTDSDPSAGTFTLASGSSLSFTVDMITRTNKGGKQEFTSAGPHLLNSGFTVKWFQDGPSAACPNWVNAKTLCSFTTGITPLYVDAQP